MTLDAKITVTDLCRNFAKHPENGPSTAQNRQLRKAEFMNNDNDLHHFLEPVRFDC